jgi:hypothetical protein
MAVVETPTKDEIEAAKTPRGGWTREQLAKWGVPWPPPHGWKAALEKRKRHQKELQRRPESANLKGR